MGWTQWRRLANKDVWYPDTLGYEGAACYELGIKGKWKRYIIKTYVGNTDNLRRRMTEYAKNGSHLHSIVSKYWKYDYTLLYRYYALSSKQKAVNMEKELLEKYGLERYPWNTHLGSPK